MNFKSKIRCRRIFASETILQVPSGRSRECNDTASPAGTILRIIFFFLLLTSYFSLIKLSFAYITFQKTYELGFGYCVQQTTDGGYIVVGTCYYDPYAYILLIKTDSLGDTLWTKRWGYPPPLSLRKGYYVRQISDNGYVIAGQYGSGTVYLIKTDSLGNQLWYKWYYTVFDTAYGYCVQQTPDEGYIIVGKKTWSSNQFDIWLIKTDSLGDTLWTKRFGVATESEIGYTVHRTPTDGGYIIAGTKPNSIWPLKTDINGDTFWTQTYSPATLNEYGNKIALTSDGGYIIIGNILVSGYYDAYLIKTDSLGNVLWAKTYCGTNNDYGNCVQQTFDGGYIIAGTTSSFGVGSSDVWLIRTDSLGDTLWTKTYGDTVNAPITPVDAGYFVEQTRDSGYIVVGTIIPPGPGDNYVYLIKTDPWGYVAGIEEGYQSIRVSEYRGLIVKISNPVRNVLTINYWLPKAGFVQIQVYNVLGRKVGRLDSGIKSAGWHRVYQNINLPSGVYFVRLVSTESSLTHKVVVIK